jgi:uncharacterized membrane protein HdeD (DUF308 family)
MNDLRDAVNHWARGAAKNAARPGLGLESLTLMLGACLLVDGVSGAVLTFHVRPQKGWGWMLLED